MRTFEFESLEEAYPQVIKAILEEGKEVSPRGILTKEISPACITITNPRKRIIPSLERKLNLGFMCAELIWMLEGSNDVNFIGHYNSMWKQFSDDKKTLNGAYGRRIFAWDAGIRNKVIQQDDKEITKSGQIIINQFQQAYELLKKDPDSRQATIVFFDPYKDYTQTKDKPCTNLMRFLIRDGKLNMSIYMRSNDINLGTPYDIFNFTMMQEIMAGLLNIEVGIYTHIVDSLHIYERDFNKMQKIINENYPVLYTNKCMDARLSEKDMGTTLNIIFEIEKLTRTDKNILIPDIILRLEMIQNKYWQSIAAMLVLYNFRKYRRQQCQLDLIKQYITNELKQLVIERYNELN